MTQSVRKRLGWIALVIVLIGGALLVGRMQTADVEPTVRRTVITTIQREASAAFYVTGTLDLTATETVSRTETAFPTLMRVLRTAQPSWPIFGEGTVTVTVRVPGAFRTASWSTTWQPKTSASATTALLKCSFRRCRSTPLSRISPSSR